MKIIYKLFIILSVVLFLFNNIKIINGEIEEIEEINDECSGVRCDRVDKLLCLTSHRPVARYIDRKIAKEKNTLLCCPICLIQSTSFCNHTTSSLNDPKLKYLSGNVYICYDGEKECNLHTNECETLPQYR
ncbi:hypothetical protein ACTFIU_007471 [Dictyostelium citrinum]